MKLANFHEGIQSRTRQLKTLRLSHEQILMTLDALNMAREGAADGGYPEAAVEEKAYTDAIAAIEQQAGDLKY